MTFPLERLCLLCNLLLLLCLLICASSALNYLFVLAYCVSFMLPRSLSNAFIKWVMLETVVWMVLSILVSDSSEFVDFKSILSKSYYCCCCWNCVWFTLCGLSSGIRVATTVINNHCCCFGLLGTTAVGLDGLLDAVVGVVGVFVFLLPDNLPK